MKLGSTSRIRSISFLIFFFGLLLIGRLYFLQIVSGDELKDKADRQYVQSSYDYFDRGSIFFKTKGGVSFPAAALKTGFILAINPSLVKNPEQVWSDINAILPIDKEDFIARAQKKNSSYSVIAHKVSPDDASKIKDLAIPGVSLYKERWRYYPGNSLAAHTLGFIAFNEDELAGRYGLERYYEDTLRRNNESVYVNFFAEIFSNIKGGIEGSNTLEGDLITSIEPSVQILLEEQLEKINEKWGSDYSGGIVMDPSNGEIVAMAVTPTFDPNNLKDETDSSIFSNPLVERVYEMGSIIKPLTMVAGIDAGAVTADTTYYDSGTVTLDKKTFSNFDGKGRGTVNMQEVLNQSLNTGVAFVVRQMGKGNFARYMKDFGIGEETGIDLPNETHGLVENLSSPRDIEYATASFGQGIAITPIQTVRALSVLANGGKLINPHIGQKIEYKIGGSKKIYPGVDEQVIKKESAEEITRMLVSVVDNALLSGAVKMDHYSIAAKTGTAQIATKGGYFDDKFLHSFFGYFPAYEAKFLVFLFSYDPKGVKYASETLTYPFMDITKFLINYYQIPPDR